MNLLAALLSVLLHSALVAFSLPAPAEKRKPQPVRIVDGANERIHFIERTETGAGERQACDEEYVGIGLTHNALGVVTDVGAGYPAVRAGIAVGDFVEGFEPMTIGRPTRVRIIRNGVTREIVLMPEKICIFKTRTRPHIDRPRGPHG